VDYARFRPHYPQELFQYLASIVPETELAWDCATGNGQAAIELANLFDHVIATDASEQQIANAQQHLRIEYRVAPAESSGLDTSSVDLITVAQALHWFDLDRFYAEARRVLKPDGVLAASAYTFLHIAPAIDAVIDHYYSKVVGPYWPPERVLVEKFEELPFSFTEIETPSFEMTAQWKMEHLLGYLRTWSATQRFIAANKFDPLENVEVELRAVWGDIEQSRRMVWPLVLHVGRA
jgi:ubiquinone/menaquinone biosynthesis C-methylase UbiE